MKNNLCTFFLLLMGISINCQSDFRKGNLVMMNGDTLKGEVNYSLGNNRYSECRFLKSGVEKTYTAEDIKSYSFDNDKYFVSGVLKNKFVEVLVDGAVSLYKFEEVYYVKKINSEPLLLNKTIQKVYVGNDPFLRENNKWKGILKIVTADCKNLKIGNNVKFNDSSIAKLLADYHKCANEEYKVFNQNRKAWTMDFGIIAAAAKNTAIVDANLPLLGYKAVVGKYQSAITPLFGFYLNFNFPRFSDRVFLQTELTYMKPSFSMSTRYDYTTIIQTDNKYSAQTLAIPVILKYRLIHKPVDIDFNVGAEYSHIFKINSLQTTQTIPYDPFTIYYNTSTQDILKLPTSQFGLLIGLSIHSKNFGFLMRAKKTATVSQTDTGYFLVNSIEAYNAGITFKF
jgi:hypothetical protein